MYQGVKTKARKWKFDCYHIYVRAKSEQEEKKKLFNVILIIVCVRFGLFRNSIEWNSLINRTAITSQHF